MATNNPLDNATRSAIDKGHQHHRAGNHAEAARILKPIAARFPGFIDLQMITGMSARNVGDLTGALACFQRAYSGSQGAPAIGNILANTLAAADRHEEALQLFSAIIAQHPDFLDAHVNRAITAEEAGDAEKGLILIGESLRRFPAHARLKAVEGSLLKNCGRSAEALAALDAAIVAEPTRGKTHLHRGIVLRSLDRADEALAAYRQAEQHGVQTEILQPLRAAALLELGEVEAARAIYESILASGDEDNEAGAALARLKTEYLGSEDPLDHWVELVRKNPNDAVAWSRLLSGRMEYKHWHRLCEEGRDAFKRFPGNPEIEFLSAMGEAWGGNRAIGVDRLAGLAAKAPRSASLATSLAEVYLTVGEPRRAEAEALQATQLAPLDQSGWTWLATAWRMLDDPREFWLCDYERFVVKIALDDREAGIGHEEFAAEVAAVLEKLHATRFAPGNQSLRAGTQTSGFLFGRQDPVLDRFKLELQRGVASATQAFVSDLSHPLLSRRTQSVAISGAWSVRLRGGEGHHVPHFHSDGWISSAYYAHLPQGMGQTGKPGDDGGFIHFGAPPEHLGLALKPRLSVKPEVGNLVMFPSYMWHGTVPFSGEGTRLTAAFDFIPK